MLGGAERGQAGVHVACIGVSRSRHMDAANVLPSIAHAEDAGRRTCTTCIVRLAYQPQPPTPLPLEPKKAAADMYGVYIVVVTSFAESPVKLVEPETPASPSTPRYLFLSFMAEVGGQGACRLASTKLAHCCHCCHRRQYSFPWRT